MTARTTTLRGVDAGRYYVESKLGYYLDRAEPPGVWRGAGAEALGLGDSIDEDDFLDLMAGVDPRTGALLEVVPAVVEFEVAVPRLRPAGW